KRTPETETALRFYTASVDSAIEWAAAVSAFPVRPLLARKPSFPRRPWQVVARWSAHLRIPLPACGLRAPIAFILAARSRSLRDAPTNVERDRTLAYIEQLKVRKFSGETRLIAEWFDKRPILRHELINDFFFVDMVKWNA